MYPVNLEQDGDCHDGASNETQRVDESDLNDVGYEAHIGTCFFPLFWLCLQKKSAGAIVSSFYLVALLVVSLVERCSSLPASLA